MQLTPDELFVVITMRTVEYATFHIEKKAGKLIRVVTEKSELVTSPPPEICT